MVLFFGASEKEGLGGFDVQEIGHGVVAGHVVPPDLAGESLGGKGV